MLLSSEAFSRSVAVERLRFLARETGSLDEPAVRQLEEMLTVPGLPLERVGGAARPGAVSLTDARGAAPDFVLLSTTPGSLAALLAQFDFTPLTERFDLSFLTGRREALVARAADGAGILIYDTLFRPRLELLVPAEGSFESRAGQEYPAGGLLAVRVWEEVPGADALRLIELKSAPVMLRPQ
jgi:hypothetical protein